MLIERIKLHLGEIFFKKCSCLHYFQNCTHMNRKAKTPQKSDSQTLALIHDFFHWNWMAAAIVVNFFAPVSSSYKGL